MGKVLFDGCNEGDIITELHAFGSKQYFQTNTSQSQRSTNDEQFLGGLGNNILLRVENSDRIGNNTSVIILEFQL